MFPPVNVEFFDFIGVPFINTLILMSSGLTVTVSHYFLIENKKKEALFWLVFTIFLGVTFSILQLIEYNRSFFSLRDGNFGSSFFILTGFHGIHVLIGSIYLLTTLVRLSGLNRTMKNFLRFELSS